MLLSVATLRRCFSEIGTLATSALFQHARLGRAPLLLIFPCSIKTQHFLLQRTFPAKKLSRAEARKYVFCSATAASKSIFITWISGHVRSLRPSPTAMAPRAGPPSLCGGCSSWPGPSSSTPPSHSDPSYIRYSEKTSIPYQTYQKARPPWL